MTDANKSNFNRLLVYRNSASGRAIGYAICLLTSTLLHYSYPFYILNPETPSLGLGMMIKAIEYAKDHGLQYAYLGSLQRSTDTYKLQFSGMEWFDGQKWQTDVSPLKEILK